MRRIDARLANLLFNFIAARIVHTMDSIGRFLRKVQYINRKFNVNPPDPHPPTPSTNTRLSRFQSSVIPFDTHRFPLKITYGGNHWNGFFLAEWK